MIKNKLINKIIAVSLTALTLSSSAVPAMAATQNVNSIASVAEDISNSQKVGQDKNQSKQTKYSEYQDDTNASTDVYITQTSTFSVTAPVIAILNGQPDDKGNYSGDVKYSVKGNIASNEIVKVVPDNSLSLSQPGKDDIECSIVGKNNEVAKTEFTYADGLRAKKELSQEYTLTTQDITAGSWHGNFNTNISLENNLKWYDITDKIDLANGENARWNMFGILTKGNSKNEYRTVNIPVQQGEKYRVTGVVYGSDRLLTARSELGYGSQYTIDNQMIPANNINGTGTIKEQVLTIPEGAKWLCISSSKFALSQFKLEKLSDDSVNITSYSSENFKWEFDKPYLTFTVDDTNDNIDEIAKVFAKHNMPCNYATQYSRINGTANNGETKKDILLKAQESGSEILAHHYLVLDDKSTENDYTEIYENIKTQLEKAGFIVNGIIVSGGSTYSKQDFSKSTKHAYAAGYLYSDLTATNNVYNHRYYNSRIFNDSADISYLKTQIDNLVNDGSGWLNIGSHVDAQWSSGHTMNPEMIDKILTYCEEKGVEVTTWNSLYNNCGVNK